MNALFTVSKKKCVACGSAQFITLYKNTSEFELTGKEKFRFEQELEGCYHCGLIRQRENPTYSNENLGKYYNASPRTPIDPGKLDKKDKRVINARKRLKFIKKQKPEGSLLEIGFGDGVFLNEAHTTYQCTGIDPSEGYSYIKDFLAAKGVKVYTQPLSKFSSKSAYDVVCVFLVLEHVMEPLAFLQQVKKLLKPGGVLILEVPDIRRYKLFNTESMLTHEHLYHYTIETLALVLAKCGFELVDHTNKDITYGFSLISAFKLKRNAKPAFKVSGFEPLALLSEFIAMRLRYRAKMAENIGSIVSSAKKSGKKLGIYGAGFLFNFAREKGGLNLKDIDYLYDDTREKAGTKVDSLRVYSLSQIKAHAPDIVLVFSEMFFELMKQNILKHANEKTEIVNIHQQSRSV